MNEALDRLAESYGVLLGYVSEGGVYQRVTDRAKRGILAALGVAADTEQEIAASLASAPSLRAEPIAASPPLQCFVPDWLEHGRAWGITCQLYGLRSGQNWGIGDFEDLARLAEYAGACGADFIGVNPLHALFLADPARRSPYSPSSRRFLNAHYISVDALGAASEDTQVSVAAAREAALVDYVGVSKFKLAALAARFSEFERDHISRQTPKALQFEEFCRRRGETLELFARYEALSAMLVADGHASGWQHWPERYQSPESDAVRRFAEENTWQVLFQKWMQWIADGQLAEAQRRARQAGMRIGLYLDLAVGATPDGADAWANPGLVVSGAHIGAPPDPFNAQGQDWGLSPPSPVTVRAQDGSAVAAMLSDLMRHAGAIRIDHVMGLVRLFWIPAGLTAVDGAYVTYPGDTIMRELAAASRHYSSLVVGEDLGTVPEGFRDLLRGMEIQGYRVLFFEREKNSAFRPPDAYSREALACCSTHDLPTLRGWWKGTDISIREHLGLLDNDTARAQRVERNRERALLLQALSRAGSHPDLNAPPQCQAAGGFADLPDQVVISAHEFLARTPSRLVAVQLEDLVGMEEQANLPGTVDQHPNWRRKMPVDLEALPTQPRFQAIVRAMAAERPRPP